MADVPTMLMHDEVGEGPKRCGDAEIIIPSPSPHQPEPDVQPDKQRHEHRGDKHAVEDADGVGQRGRVDKIRGHARRRRAGREVVPQGARLGRHDGRADAGVWVVRRVGRRRPACGLRLQLTTTAVEEVICYRRATRRRIGLVEREREPGQDHAWQRRVHILIYSKRAVGAACNPPWWTEWCVGRLQHGRHEPPLYMPRRIVHHSANAASLCCV
jgi:hypothetical protein